MKRILMWLVLPCMLGVGCHTTRPVVKVGSDIKLGAPIKQFKTFSWAADIDQIPSDEVFVGPNGVLVYNNETVRSKIKDAIKYELTAKGFEMNESDPDMVVNFIVFEQKGKLRTYNGYQVVMGDSLRTPESVQMTKVKPGTLFVTIRGGDNEGVVWQGYASGILSEESVKSDAKIKAAVEAIFDKFDYKAFNG